MATTRTMLASERDLLYQWYQAQQRLDEAKALESKLRALVVSTSKSGLVEEGRESISVDANGDYKLVIDHKMSYSFDFKRLPPDANDLLKEVQEHLNTILNVDCILVKFEFSSTNYKKANENVRAALADFVTTKPGTPQVSLVEPSTKDAL